MGFSTHIYWSELPGPPPGDLPEPGIKHVSLMFPALAGGFFILVPSGKPQSESVSCSVVSDSLWPHGPHGSLPGSSVHGILQTRILEWVGIPFSRGFSQHRDWTWVSCIAGDGKESTWNAEGLGSIPGLGRSPEGEHGNPLQYSCLENPQGQGAWLATVHGVTKSQTWLRN